MEEVLSKLRGVVVLRLQGATADGDPLVRVGARTLRARSVWMPAAPDWSSCRGREVLVGFEEGDEERPIVLGLLEPPPPKAPAEPRAETEAAPPKSLRIESQEELVLECGKARISLRSDGRILILGGYVLSRSTGVNKLKGGSVQIN